MGRGRQSERGEEEGSAAGPAGFGRLRALNDREVMRCSSAFQAIDFDKQDAGSTLQLAEAMETIISTAFIQCAENGTTTEDVEVVLHSIKTGPLIALGSWILSASGMGADPT